MKYPKDLKGFKPIVYLRFSADEQSPADKGKPLEKNTVLKNQLERIQKWLKSNGLSQASPNNIHYELASGGDPTRPVLKRAINQAVEMKGKRMFVVSELSRFHRDIRHGMAETIPLYENDIPLVATDDNLITGTMNEPEGDNDILMGLKISLATGERERLRGRVKRAITERQEQGIFASKGLELFPEADGDIWGYMIDNESKIGSKKEGGIGNTEFLRLLDVVYGRPFGKTVGFLNSVKMRLEKMRANMTPDEFNEWNEFRRRILEMERKLGANSWEMKAVRYRVNGYITDPTNENYSMKPSEEIIQNALDNPADNLSFKEAKKYRSQVSKRAKK